MKKCITCLDTKEYIDFYEAPENINGYKGQCIVCFKAKELETSRTKKGFVAKIYNNQKKTSKTRGHNQPEYTQLELYKWCIEQDIFHSMFIAWEKSNYYRPLRPSIDRKEDDKGYSISNIQLMTLSDNTSKATRIKRPIEQIQHGRVIEEYASIQDATNKTGIHRSQIHRVLSGSRQTTGGYEWRYKI